MTEFIVGGIIAIGIVAFLVIKNSKTESENKDINSTALPLPPKPPTGTPE